MSQLSFESLFLADQADPQPQASAPARMLSPAEARKQFASVFRQTAKNMRRSEVFSDFITLAASDGDSHVETIAQLAELFMNEEDVAAIMAADTKDDILRILARY